MKTPREIVMSEIAGILEYHGLSWADIKSEVRFKSRVKARRVVFWWLFNMHGWNLSKIARFMDFDHTTVLLGIGCINFKLGKTSDKHAVRFVRTSKRNRENYHLRNIQSERIAA